MEVNPEGGGRIDRVLLSLLLFSREFPSTFHHLPLSLSLSLSCIVIVTCFKVDQPLSATACSKNESSFRGGNDLSLISVGDASLTLDRHRRSDMDV